MLFLWFVPLSYKNNSYFLKTLQFGAYTLILQLQNLQIATPAMQNLPGNRPLVSVVLFRQSNIKYGTD